MPEIWFWCNTDLQSTWSVMVRRSRPRAMKAKSAGKVNEDAVVREGVFDPRKQYWILIMTNAVAGLRFLVVFLPWRLVDYHVLTSRLAPLRIPLSTLSPICTLERMQFVRKRHACKEFLFRPLPNSWINFTKGRSTRWTLRVKLSDPK